VDYITVDCATGEVTCTPLTPDQIAARQAAADQAAAKQQAATAARQQLVATVQASTDPALLALAQLLEVIPNNTTTGES
jgi:hypothetical protein